MCRLCRARAKQRLIKNEEKGKDINFISMVFIMAKFVMYYPQFGWFDGARSFNANEFHPNAADPIHKGVSVVYSFQNNTSKTIKYLGVWFDAYNRVGDKIGESKGAKFTGPVAPNAWEHGVVHHNVWHTDLIGSVKVAYVIAEYMDGTCEKFEPKDIEFRTKPVAAPSPASTSTSSGGCYVATAVYGSYDCPEVWTLRRFRDDHLAKTLKGRAFIRTYYAISPTLVKWFGETEWFKSFWKKHLDRMINELQKDGYENTPYDDKEW